MKAKLLYEDDGQRTFALVFETGDSVMDLLRAFAVQANLPVRSSPASAPSAR